MATVLVTTRNPQDEFCDGDEGDLDCCAEAQHGHCDCWFDEDSVCCQCGERLGPIVHVEHDDAFLHLVTPRYRGMWR